MSVTDAAALVRFALDSRASALADPERTVLLSRFHGDEAFSVEVHHVADGLGLDILPAGPDALVLSARSESPFAPRLEDYPLTVRTAADRLGHGLIHVAIAAMAYPRESDLEDQARVVRLSVHEVDEHLWRLADERAQSDPAAGEALDGDVSLVPAWASWWRQRRAGQTADGRSHSRTTRRWVEVAFDWLVDYGLAQRVSDAAGGTYRLTRRHRTLVREVTSQRLIAAIDQAGN